MYRKAVYLVVLSGISLIQNEQENFVVILDGKQSISWTW